jgi:glycosyltransferase involved in cell wall biosynthesis
MKIAFYLKHFPPLGLPLLGGTAMAVGGLANGLLSLKQNVTVLCEGQTNSAHVTANGCQILSFQQNSSRNLFGIAKGLQEYLKFSSERPDLFVVNGCFHPSLFFVGKAAAANGTPYVAASHTHYHPALFQRRPYLKWPYWYLIEKRFLKGARAIQLYDTRHTAYLRQLGIDTRFLAVPNGFSPCDLPDNLPIGHTTKKMTHLVFRGRIDPHHKGLDLLLQAVAQLKDSHSIKLTIQGPDFGEKKWLEKLAQQLCITPVVSFIGPDYSPPYSFLSQHNIFCLPSRFEGFGIAALEAMLAGRVLLVTRSAGIAPHVVESGCGVLVEPDKDSIVNGLCELISRRADWDKMGLDGQRYAMHKLNWTQIAGETLADYQSLI